MEALTWEERAARMRVLLIQMSAIEGEVDTLTGIACHLEEDRLETALADASDAIARAITDMANAICECDWVEED